MKKQERGSAHMEEWRRRESGHQEKVDRYREDRPCHRKAHGWAN